MKVTDLAAPDEDVGAELPPPSEPMAVARQLLDRAYVEQQCVTLHRYRGGWWRWCTTHWREVDEANIRRAAYRFTERAVYVEVAKKGPRKQPWRPNRYKVSDVVEALGALCLLDELVDAPDWIVQGDPVPARADRLISVRNGLLHIHGRTLHPHTPRLFNVVTVPFDYQPDAVAPLWLAFLDELWPDDPDSIAALQEFFGCIISGRTDLHKILLLIGPTRAGKGVIERVLKSLIGERNTAGPTLASLGTNFGLQPLIGKPLAIIADARLGNSRNVHEVVERLLSISGEDHITVDRKFREPWNGKLPTRFMLISNELPRFGDASGAIANRFVVLALRKSWLGHEDTTLTDRLLPELPGILNWSLDGMERLATAGRFTEPASARDAITALLDLVSPVSAFVRDRCEQGTHDVERRELFAAWRAWCDETGHRPGTESTFGRDLRAVIPTLRSWRPRDGTERPWCYRGLRLTPTDNAWSSRPSWTNGPEADPGPTRSSGPRTTGPSQDFDREPGEDREED
jgi:putative DNA primase/helicase